MIRKEQHFSFIPIGVQKKDYFFLNSIPGEQRVWDYAEILGVLMNTLNVKSCIEIRNWLTQGFEVLKYPCLWSQFLDPLLGSLKERNHSYVAFEQRGRSPNASDKSWAKSVEQILNITKYNIILFVVALLNAYGQFFSLVKCSNEICKWKVLNETHN